MAIGSPSDDGAARRVERAGRVVDDDVGAVGDADLAHLAGDEGRVGGHAAPGGEDALRGEHAADVLRAGLQPHEDDLLAPGHVLLGGLRREDRLARRAARTRGESLGDEPLLGDGLAAILGIEHGLQELVQLVGLDAQQRLRLGDQPLALHLHRDARRGEAGPLSGPCLQHPQLAVLDRELDVLHVAVVVLQRAANGHQLAMTPGHHRLERLLPAGVAVERERVRMPATTSSP